MRATYRKLANGRWGISTVNGIPVKGQHVEVEKRNGDIVAEVVDQIITSGFDNSVCSILHLYPLRARKRDI